MYSELVKNYSVKMYDLTRQYNNGQLEDENYYNEINYLLKEVERKTKINEHLLYTEKIIVRINNIIIKDPKQRSSGYVEGLYNSLDIIINEFERGKNNND